MLSSEIVQVADLDTEDGVALDKGVTGFSSGGTRTLKGRRARWPLAMIRKRDSGAFALFQVTHFELMHRASIPANKDGTPGSGGRHFFFAAP